MLPNIIKINQHVTSNHKKIMGELFWDTAYKAYSIYATYVTIHSTDIYIEYMWSQVGV